MKIKKIAIVTLLFLAVISFSACNKKKHTSSSMPSISAQLPTDQIGASSSAEAKSELALNLYLQQLLPQIDKVKTQIADSYSDIKVDKNGTHGLTITYQMNKNYAIDDKAVQQINSSFHDFNSSILSNMQKAGVIDPTLQFIVLNGDGSTVINTPFTP